MRELLFLVLWTGGISVIPLITGIWLIAWCEKRQWSNRTYNLRWWHVLTGIIISLVPFINFLVAGCLVTIVLIIWLCTLDWNWVDRDVFQKPRRGTDF